MLIVITLGSWRASGVADFEDLESSWYVGGAVGMSGLQPEGYTSWDMTDENDVAKKVYAGFNIGQNFGLEAFWIDFGEATVTSKTSVADAKVKYRGYGANVIYHAPSYFGPGLPIVKIGVAKLSTEGEGVAVNQQNNVNVMMGAEYELDKGFRARAEYEYFDKDIDQTSIGLN